MLDGEVAGDDDLPPKVEQVLAYRLWASMIRAV